MICECCGKGEARKRHVTRSYGEGNSLLIVEDVPVITCPDCGQSYLTAETLHEIERIKRHRRNIATERTVPVVKFTLAS